jgi:hypothetical protein
MAIATPTTSGEFDSSSVSQPSTTVSPIAPIELRSIDTPRRRKSGRDQSADRKMLSIVR